MTSGEMEVLRRGCLAIGLTPTTPDENGVFRWLFKTGRTCLSTDEMLPFYVLGILATDLDSLVLSLLSSMTRLNDVPRERGALVRIGVCLINQEKLTNQEFRDLLQE